VAIPFPIQLSSGTPPLILHTLKGKFDSDHVTWGYRTQKDAEEKRWPWINAGIEKALTGRYFRHMFREGRVIVPGGVWLECAVENGKKQPWYYHAKGQGADFHGWGSQISGRTPGKPSKWDSSLSPRTAKAGWWTYTTAADCSGTGGRLALDGR
jgi:hypothetical protein